MGMSGLCWKEDRSGDFISYSKKVGALRLWNVAHREPK